MRNSSVLVGMVLGLVLAALLAVPLVLDLPGGFVPRWSHLAPGVALLAWLGAVVVPVCAGFVAGRINDDESLRAGTGAGTVTALVALVHVGAPAAGIWSASGLYLATAGTRLGTSAVEDLLGGALTTAGWAVPAFGTALLLAGLALGALGGFLAEVSGSGRRTRLIHRSSVPMTGLLVVTAATTFHCVLGAHLELALLPALHQPVGLLDRVSLTAPLLAAGVANVLLLSWTFRDAVLSWRSGRRVGGVMWAALAGSLAVSGHLLSLLVYPYSWIGPWPWLAVGAEAIAVLTTVVRHWNSNVALAEAPRHWFELAIEGLEMGLVSVALFVLVGGATSTWLVQLLPTAWAVASGGSSIELDPGALVTRQFLVHLGAPVPMILVAITYAVLATPLWLVGLALLRRAEARTQ